MRSSFSGWYFRCQSDHQTLAVIPSVHQTASESFCSLQLITQQNAWSVHLPYSALQYKHGAMEIAGNRFGADGIQLDLHTDDLHVEGALTFGPLTPIRSDIMGPFRYLPLLECRHSVYSMKHAVNGTLAINGTQHPFQDAAGYWEGDRGRSFPKEYAWTQCSFPEGSLMLSVAKIPLFGRSFTGIISAILWHGKEYRLATYQGAKLVKNQNRELIIEQGRRRLHAKLLSQNSHPLRAPTFGEMTRTIHEHICCRAFYRLEEDGKTIFAFDAPNAAFEYEYPQQQI